MRCQWLSCPRECSVTDLGRGNRGQLLDEVPVHDRSAAPSGEAVVIDLPEAVEPFVDYYRVIAGEHPDWEEYRRAMVEQGKCLIRITPRRWGPLATGGFPPS